MQEINSLIKDQEAIHLEYVSNQALDTQASYFGAAGRQPLSCPDQNVMGQGFQLDQHLLSFETALIALSSSQSLLIFLDFDLYTAAPFIIVIHVGQGDGGWVFYFLLFADGQQ